MTESIHYRWEARCRFVENRSANETAKKINHAPKSIADCRGGIPTKLAGFEWIEDTNIKLPKIRFVSCGNDQVMDARSGGNHCVLQ